jgi:hypothetical protein
VFSSNVLFRADEYETQLKFMVEIIIETTARRKNLEFILMGLVQNGFEKGIQKNHAGKN